MLDGRLEIDNNRSERSIKPFVIGRKAWLFSNTPRGAKASSVIYSIVYIKMLILRAYTEQNKDARERLRKKNDVLRKYVDETYHIENDYIYSLDVRRFNIVPENYITDADMFVTDELAQSGSADMS